MKKVLSLIIIFVLGALNTQAQWEQMNGPYDGDVFSLVQNGNYLYAGTRNGFYRSSDNGESWQEKNSGLGNLYDLGNLSVYSLIQIGNYLYAVTYDDVFRSSDNGDSWQEKSSGLDNRYVFSLIQIGNYLYVGTRELWPLQGGGVYRSSDNGDNWQYKGLYYRNVKFLVLIGNYLYAGTFGGVYRSSDNGDNWQEKYSGMDKTVVTLINSGNYLYAGTYSGVYRSSDNGDNWRRSGLDKQYVTSLIQIGNYLYAVTDIGAVFRSSDNGDSWQEKNSGMNTQYVYSLIQIGNYLYAGTDKGVWRLPIESSPSELVSPVDQATDIGLTPEFRWTHEQGIDNYALWVYTDRTNPTSRVVEVIVPAKDYLVGEEIIYRAKEVLQTEKRYYWQVRKNKDDGEMIGENSFTTGKTPNSAHNLMIGDVSYGLNILRTYPNPSEGTLTIEIEENAFTGEIFTLEIYDMFGRNVGEFPMTASGTIDVSNLPVGHYRIGLRTTQNSVLFASGSFTLIK
jgi:photosystem II stability/assembly factor-like uncharacterized protein